MAVTVTFSIVAINSGTMGDTPDSITSLDFKAVGYDGTNTEWFQARAALPQPRAARDAVLDGGGKMIAPAVTQVEAVPLNTITSEADALALLKTVVDEDFISSDIAAKLAARNAPPALPWSS
jgi:hypothetical protein